VISTEQMCRVPAWFSGRGPEADVVISSRVRLARNLADLPFPGRASLEERSEIFEMARAVCPTLPPCAGFSVTNFTVLPRLNQQLLMEEHTVSRDLVDAEGDRGLMTGADSKLGVQVNEEDHFRLQALDSGLCAEGLLKSVDTLDTAMGQAMRFAYDRRRGYLTACPTNAGTGLRISFLLHLPGLALTKAIDQVLQAASHMSMATRGFFGENSEIVGTFFQVSNQATMGSTEAEFLAATEGLVRQVVSMERDARQRLLKDARTELSDKVHRAYGILRYARTLSVTEFLNLSSALRIGVECELLRGLSALDLNRLTLVIMPAHLQTLYGRQIEADEQAVLRAETVRGLLKQNVDET
jgi:protein arginine kinase